MGANLKLALTQKHDDLIQKIEVSGPKTCKLGGGELEIGPDPKMKL